MPESLGHLRRVRHLGDSDLTSVWLYYDDEADADVAVKVLADDWARRDEIKQRFVEEARILREAAAEHIVAVHDIGETEDGTPYVVMTNADQGTVADLIDHAPIDPATVEYLLKQACEGVANLHRVGLVHRDVKPSNLLICTDENGGQRVLVSDLGLVKATLYASGLTETGGDPRYLAPEQGVLGGEVDERADVHALGAVAYHLLTGQPVRETPVRDIASATEPPLASELGEIPWPVANVVRGAVHPDPDARTPDPDAFSQALDANVMAFLSLPTFSGQKVETPRTQEQTQRLVDQIRAEAEAEAEAHDRPGTASWLKGRLITLVVSVAIVAIAGLILQGGDDDTEERLTPDELTSLPPAAASAYCQSLPLDWTQATTLASPETTNTVGVDLAADAVHESRQKAPPAIADAWAEVDDPLGHSAAALDRAGATWDDLTGHGSRDEPALPEARRALATAIDRFGAVRADIERHADASCEVDLDAYAFDVMVEGRSG